MRIKSNIVCALLLLAACAYAEPAEQPPELWFPVGETLTYGLNWGIIPVGKAWITTSW